MPEEESVHTVTEGDFEPTNPTPSCDGDPSCGGLPAVLVLGTGERLCAEHAVLEMEFRMVRERESRDTDPAPPSLPPPSG